MKGSTKGGQQHKPSGQQQQQQFLKVGKYNLEQSPHSATINMADMFDANDLEREFLQQRQQQQQSSSNKPSTYFDAQAALSFLNSSYDAVLSSKNYELFSATGAHASSSNGSSSSSSQDLSKQSSSSSAAPNRSSASNPSSYSSFSKGGTAPNKTNSPVNAWKK